MKGNRSRISYPVASEIPLSTTCPIRPKTVPGYTKIALTQPANFLENVKFNVDADGKI
jgi:hypothetical protein